MQNVWRRRIIINNSSLQIWNLNVLELFKVWRKYIFKNIPLTVQKPGRKTQGIQRHLPSQLRRNQIKNNDHKISTSLAPMETVSFVFPIPSMLPKASGNIDVTGKQNSQFPVGPVIKCVATHAPPNSKRRNKITKNYFLNASWHNKFAAISRFMTPSPVSGKFSYYLTTLLYLRLNSTSIISDDDITLLCSMYNVTSITGKDVS